MSPEKTRLKQAIRLRHETQAVLTAMGRDLTVLDQTGRPELFYRFFERHLFDPHFQKPPQYENLPKSQIPDEAQAYFKRKLPPEYVVTATYFHSLYEAGWRPITFFDINSVSLINRIGHIFGTRNISDVFSSINKGFGKRKNNERRIAVRADGDEGTLMERPTRRGRKVTPEALKRRVQSTVKALYWDSNTRESVFKETTIKTSQDEPEKLVRRKIDTTYTADERKERLSNTHPETRILLELLSEVSEQYPAEAEEYQKLIENGVTDHNVQRAAERLTKQYGIDLFVHRNEVDFFDHLQMQGTDHAVVLIDIPGALKKANQVNRDIGDDFLEWELENIVLVSMQYFKQIRVLRDVARFYMVVPPESFSQLETLMEQIEIQLTQENHFLTESVSIPTIASTSLTSFHIVPDDDVANSNSFQQLIDDFLLPIWMRTAKNISKFLQEHDKDNIWLYYSNNILNPTEPKRGRTNCELIGLSPSDIQSLALLYTKTEDPTIPGVLSEDQLESYKKIIKPILEIS